MSNKFRSYSFVWESSGHKVVGTISESCTRCHIIVIALGQLSEIYGSKLTESEGAA